MKRSIAVLALSLALVSVTSCAKAVSTTFDDPSITMRVKTLLVNDQRLGVQRIDVDTFRGVVTLSGRVETKEDEQKAIELARKGKGVVEVKSTLQIGSVPTTPRS